MLSFALKILPLAAVGGMAVYLLAIVLGLSARLALGAGALVALAVLGGLLLLVRQGDTTILGVQDSKSD